MTRYDLLLRSGMLVIETDPVRADLAVSDGRIAAIGAELAS